MAAPTTTWEQLRAEIKTILGWACPVIGTCSAQGTTTTLIDTPRFQDNSGDYIYSESLTGMWIFRPDAAATGDRERRIAGLASDTGTLTIGVAWTNVPANAEQYEIWRIRPEIVFNQLEMVMRNFRQTTYQVIPFFTDADMEASGTSSYALSGAGAVSKVTALANVETGSQALFFNAATASEYVEGPSVRVLPSTQYFGSAIVRVDAGGPVYLAVWDKTNDAEIESGNRVDHSLEAFMSMQRTFNTPATCEEVAFRVYVTGSSDDAYIDCFSGPIKLTDVNFDLPTFITQDSEVRKLYIARYGVTHPSESGVYDARSRTFYEVNPQNYHARFGLHHAHAGRIEFRDGYSLPYLGEVWIECIRFAADVTTFAYTSAGETSPTTGLPRRLLGLAVAYRLCEWVTKNPDAVTDHVASTADASLSMGMVAAEVTPLVADYAKSLEVPQYPQEHPLNGRAFQRV